MALNKQKILSVNQLHIDSENPRLKRELRNKSEDETLSFMKRYFDLEELAYSMAENGYFSEEPLIAIPQDRIKEEEFDGYLNNPESKFIIVEGNRRLSTLKFLLSEELRSQYNIRSWPTVSDEKIDNLTNVPVIVYLKREDVLPYLGVRHITGIKKWEPFAKATYIAEMIESGLTIDDIQRQVGDRSNSARKIYICYKLISEIEDVYNIETLNARNNFSFLLLSLGQKKIKDYLGLPTRWSEVDENKPIDESKLENLKNLFSWLFGDEKYKFPVIQESRDITNYLSHVIACNSSLQHLTLTRDLTEAFERSDGEKNLIIKNLKDSSRKLSNTMAFISKFKDKEDVLNEFENLFNIISAMKQTLK